MEKKDYRKPEIKSVEIENVLFDIVSGTEGEEGENPFAKQGTFDSEE